MSNFLNVSLRVVKANNLRIGDIRTSDPYVIGKFVTIAAAGFRTATMHNTLSPVYDVTETWEFSDIPSMCEIQFKLYDRDLGMEEDDFLGECSLALQKTQGTQSFTIPVIWNKKQCGTLTVEIVAQPVVGLPAAPPRRSSTVHFNRFDSVPVGLATNTKTSASATNPFGAVFSCWEIELNRIERSPLQLFPWNKNYPPGQKIYSDTPSARLVRMMVHKEHLVLYHRRGDEAHTNRGLVVDGADFFRIINYGKRRNVSRVFTYVVVDAPDAGGPFFRFSETGTTFMKDFASKHAVHADAATEVRAAGEFVVVDKGEERVGGETDRYELVLDNASGTFSPDVGGVERLALILQAMLPGLRVSAYGYYDERLADIKKPIAEESNKQP
ncbi:C2-domain-containing protein [Gonapodya prolifera JEL478]|uniref:C2-domain-containing protein n=1 Tax=Gonapodya prolifera (strain JEL478) TaxID=1344416 RepID=A0A139AHV3_GONPJ|nr:C2-domain-containing protein [Gonapodya prolifera JEL478]|eukprot:KXS16124.1 C2-domain-containing protein [Gonapodya prolifera JEL478]